MLSREALEHVIDQLRANGAAYELFHPEWNLK